MEINDSVRTSLVRKGNELFNLNDIEGAYRCYITASYYGGIERVADYYFFNKKDLIKAYRLYKLIAKEDSNLGGNERAKKKIENICESFAKGIRKWLNEDEYIKYEKENNDIVNRYYSKAELTKEKFYTKQEKQDKSDNNE